MAGVEASIGMLEALRRRAREGGSYLVRVSLARNCSWLQDFGLFPENEVRGAGLPESMMTEPGLQAKFRPEFDLPLVTATGPLGEVSVVPHKSSFPNSSWDRALAANRTVRQSWIGQCSHWRGPKSKGRNERPGRVR